MTNNKYQIDDPRLTHAAFVERVLDLLGSENEAYLSDKSGLARSTIYNALHKNEPTRDRLIRIADALNTSVEYLTTGQYPNTPESETVFDDGNVVLGLLTYAELMVDLELSVKTGSLIPNTRSANRIKLTLSPAWFENNRLDPGFTRLVLCQSDTMETTVHQGDYLVVDVTPKQPIIEGVYMLQVGQALTLRRMAASPSGMNAMPDNPRYTPFKVTLDDDGQLTGDNVAVIGRVFWVLQSFNP